MVFKQKTACSCKNRKIQAVDAGWYNERMRNVAGRRGRILLVIASVALGGYVLGASVGSVSAAQQAGLDLNIFYTTAKTFQLKLDSGAIVSSIPAGSYTVLVFDDASTDPTPAFVMSGPGVSITSDLDSTGMGIDTPTSFGPFNFAAGGSYSIKDSNLAGSATTLTVTAASGGSTASTTTPPTTSTTTPPVTTQQTTTTRPATTTTTPSGPKVMGTVKASVSAAGKATLSFSGKAVTSLAAGRYTVTVADRSAKAGFILGKPGHPVLLSGVKTVGTSSHTLTLTAGKWFFEGAIDSPKVSFTVTK